MNQTTKEPAVRTAAKTHMSASPHLRNRLTTGKVMLQVLLSLLPAAVVGVWVNGFHAFLVIAVCMLSTVAAEAIFCFVTRKPFPPTLYPTPDLLKLTRSGPMFALFLNLNPMMTPFSVCPIRARFRIFRAAPRPCR